MILAEGAKKIKHFKSFLFTSGQFRTDITKDFFIGGMVILVGISGFFLGKLSSDDAHRQDSLRVVTVGDMLKGHTGLLAGVGDSNTSGITALQEPPKTTLLKDQTAVAPSTTQVVSASVKGVYVGAKSGKTYYLPWCSGVKRIKEENKVWFQDKIEAQQAGYTASKTCKGM